jgi:hypothetical protein
MAAGVGGVARRKLGIDSGGLWGSSGKPRAAAWAAVFSDPSGMVDTARAMAHWHGGQLHTTARVSTIVDQNSP